MIFGIILCMCISLSACGFHPLYGSASRTSSGETGHAQADLRQIRVDTIADRQGQKLRNDLIDIMQGDGIPPPPLYNLVITYTESQADLGLSNDAITTRGQLTISATFILKNLQTGGSETTGTTQEITGYNIQNSEFATILSRDDAEDRALSSTADNIATRLALYFQNRQIPKPPDTTAKPSK